MALTCTGCDERPCRAHGRYARLSSAALALGLEPDAAIDEVAALLENYAIPSSLSVIHRSLMLEWFGVREVARRDSGPLAKQDLANVLVRMATLDALTSFTADEAALALGRSGQDIREMLSSRRLYGYEVDRKTMIPGWQFELNDGNMPQRVISPKLKRVVEAIPDASPPALVRGLMTLEDPSLPTQGGQLVSPRDWLLRGGSPFPVAATLARHLQGSRFGVLDMSIVTA